MSRPSMINWERITDIPDQLTATMPETTVSRIKVRIMDCIPDASGITVVGELPKCKPPHYGRATATRTAAIPAEANLAAAILDVDQGADLVAACTATTSHADVIRVAGGTPDATIRDVSQKTETNAAAPVLAWANQWCLSQETPGFKAW